MRSFYHFYLKNEAEIVHLEKSKWFVFDDSLQNEIEVFLNFKDSYFLKKGNYFKAVRLSPERYYIIDNGNVPFFERGMFIRMKNEKVLSSYFKEEDAIRASELSFEGFPDPEGENFDEKPADRLDDIGLTHK